jgi:hypothetical protein
VFRDILAGKPSIIIRPELYVTAAALAAGAYVALVFGGIEPGASATVAFTIGFGLRALAIVKGFRYLHTTAANPFLRHTTAKGRGPFVTTHPLAVQPQGASGFS